MSEVILVGNGASVMDQELGKTIDSFDTVVRFNWFHIKGFEKQVGSKTDIWFTTVYDKIRLRNTYEAIYEHSWEWNPVQDKTYNLLKGDDSVTRLHKTSRQMIYDMDNYMRLKRGEVKRMDRHNSYLTWSTGAIAAWWFLSDNFDKQYRPKETYDSSGRTPSCDSVSLIGFDWWDLESDDNHHLGDKQTLGRNHKPKTELAFWQYLAEDGKVIDLNPNSRIMPERDE
jgi:hypothetical protein